MRIGQNHKVKILESSDYNFVFNKENGFFARWGKNKDDDPQYGPSPEILDLEISSGGDCMGNCKFCSPSGTLINTPNGKIPIEELNKGDLVIGYDTSSKSIKINEIEETYEREYKGEIFCIELSNGETLRLTPEHLVILNNGKEVEVQNLTEKDFEKIISF